MHTFTASGKTNITAVIAAMLSSLGTTRQCDDCLVFDRHGRAYTSAWRLAGGWGVSFRHASSGLDRAYYRTAWDAALAVRGRAQRGRLHQPEDGRPARLGHRPHPHHRIATIIPARPDRGQAGAARPGLAR
jgi:hypothetical protein